MRQKIQNNISAIGFTVIFLLLIAAVGIASFVKLVNFYVNDETDYNEWTADLGNPLETDMATNFYGKLSFVNLNGIVRNVLDQREMNGVVKLDNGWLTTTYSSVPNETLRGIADEVITLKEYLDERDIAFLYGIPPYTVSKFDPQLPEGIMDFGNDNLDRLGVMLEDGGVDVIDFRETMHEDGISQYDMIYRTDHHWTTKAGFYAYLKINKWLEQVLECQVDPEVKDFFNYTATVYKEWHLGSRGQRTGICFAGIDDFELILPNFDTELIREGSTGTYESLIIDRSSLQNRDQTSRYTYDSVLGNANSNYINPSAWNNKKLLVMADSFGKAVNPFLILSYQELQYGCSALSFEYIETYKPDAVIMFYHVDNAVSPMHYDFTFSDEM